MEPMRLSILVLALALAGCGEAGAQGYRKEFRILENQLRLRLQLHFAYHQRYPQDLAELEEPGGYRLPTLPEGYYLDYDPAKGNACIRAREDEAGDL
jgi:hypothetical protein